MSTQNNKIGSDDVLRPQVVVIETPEKSGAGIAEPLAPRVIATAGTGRIIPAPPRRTSAHSRIRRPAIRLVDEARFGGSGRCVLRLARR